MTPTVASNKQRKLAVPKFLNPFSTSAQPGSAEHRGTDATDDSAREKGADREGSNLSLPQLKLNQLSTFVFGNRRRSSGDGSTDHDDPVEEEDAEVAAHLEPEYFSLLSPTLEDPSSPNTPMLADIPGLQRTMSVLSTSTLTQVVSGTQELPHVPSSYRVPTAKQAFYDTHMGSSSGWTSLKGKADTVLRPFGGGTDQARRKSADKAGKHDERGVSPARMAQSQPPSQDTPNGHGASANATSKQPKTGWTSYLPSDILPSVTGISIFGSSSTPAHTQNDLDVIPVIGPRHHRASEFFNDVKGYNVVILGGYRGSVLRDAKTHQMLWIPLKVGTGFRRPVLELGLSPSAEDNATDLIEPDESLSRIGRMVDMSSRLQAKLARKGANVYPWGFDWRLSLGQSSKRLRKFLEELYEASSDDPKERKGAIVVAHSMGGLVALHALSQASDPRVFHTLSFGSTPFLGTPNILGPLAYGDAALYNTTICSPRSTFSWRSTFYLLPRDKLCFETESGERKEVDFLDLKLWEWAGLSPVVRSTRRWQERQRSQAADRPKTDKPRQSAESGKDDRQKEAELADNAQGPGDVPGAAPIDGPALRKPRTNDEEGSQGMQTSASISSATQEGLLAAQHVAQGAEDMATGAETDETQALSAENQEEPAASSGRADGPSEVAEDEIWDYLKRTLQEVRTFDEEINSGFDEDKLARGLYPPITMLTSGRTPTTRGALVEGGSHGDATSLSSGTGPQSNGLPPPPPLGSAAKDDSPAADWRSSVRSSDYSRMLYGKGDGVITLRSSTSIPGGWKKCLVTDDKEASSSSSDAGDEGWAWLTESSHRHVSLFSDVDGIGRAIWIAMRKRQRTRVNERER
ncbi:hypothetical protein BCV69DRAFT_312455 [Microstroma glucosiphilum]|uniref:Alpha/beta-hydrolase n=1 Tax=Pseudomicrostroma glucosiphilum TaxID=1684307 RepID=A0A316U8M3_9BASI|nr:hypothetical protein BCV69DRAFT_312455 [Pseudomicrostroma glucosiphilum]PWN21204.1 hypothetical protein BCV69DRAFT_312455 [Pseudomicrostroma glucosiphilum]